MGLDRMKQPVSELEVEVRGLRRDEHPTVFTELNVEVVVSGAGVDPDAVSRALEQCEMHVAPVWAMLKAGTPITSSFRIVEDGASAIS
jgi:putative redox protein